MKRAPWTTCVVSVLMLGCLARAEEAATTESARERIGVYDSRAVAVAYAGSEAFDKWLKGLMAERDKAKAEGNQKRADELEARMIAQQKLFHKQCFSTVPVDDILEHVKGDLPEIERKAGVDALVSKWDKATLAKHKNAELVDVTIALVDAFHPNEKQRRSAIEIQQHKPIPLFISGWIKD